MGARLPIAPDGAAVSPTNSTLTPTTQDLVQGALREALRRLARPRRALTGKDIHEARKAIRRARAGLRWSIAQAAVKDLDSRLRSLRARMSALRDRNGLIEAIDRLRREAALRELAASLRWWRSMLKRDAARELKRFDRSLRHRRVVAELQQALTDVGALALADGAAAQRRTARSFVSAQRELAAVRGLRSAPRRHDARRRVRLLALQLKLLTQLARPLPRRVEPLLIQRLNQALGAEHDFALLIRRAPEALPARYAVVDALEHLLTRALKRNDRRASLALGRRRTRWRYALGAFGSV